MVKQALITALAALSTSTLVPAVLSQPAPFECTGCTADNGTGTVLDMCPGTNWYVKVETTPTNGLCQVVNGECEASPCMFKTDFEWRLPSGTSVDVCNSYNANRYCLNPAPVADGSDEDHEYNLFAGCNETQYRLSTGGSSPCGPYLRATSSPAAVAWTSSVTGAGVDPRFERGRAVDDGASSRTTRSPRTGVGR